MNKSYKVSGMTCDNCRKQVEETLAAVDGINSIKVNLATQEALVSSNDPISADSLQVFLAQKYKISEATMDRPQTKGTGFIEKTNGQKTKFQQLKPLLIILFYITIASFLLHFKEWNTKAFMLDFMGIFLIVFSFFKILDLKGFPESFRMYDPLAKKIRIYALSYPFLETVLGLMLLLRIEVTLAIGITLIILSITTFGVLKSLIDKKSIRCACLGTALNLPMTEATFIENAIMIAMGLFMLFVY